MILVWIHGWKLLFCTTNPERKAKTLGRIVPQLNSWLCQALPLTMCPCAGYSKNTFSSLTWKIQIHWISMRITFNIYKSLGRAQKYLLPPICSTFLRVSHNSRYKVTFCYNIKVKLALSPPLYYVVKMLSILEMRLMHVIISGCCYLLLLKFSFSASHFASCLWLHFYFAVYYRTGSLSLCYCQYCQL